MLLTDGLYYVGVNDRTKHRFEGLWSLPQGVSYNSYLLVGSDAVALVDTVEMDFFFEYLAKIKVVLGERPIDYLIINHMEPDHSGSISLIRKYYPQIKLIGNKKTMEMLEGFYSEKSENDVVVTDGATLSLGGLELSFHLTTMLHWPETMMTYESVNGVLFSGDAFGCFGALNGHVKDEIIDVEPYWREMERYYAAILGKYGAQVQAGLKKLSSLKINMICSTHGPVWQKHLSDAIAVYDRLSSGKTEKGLVICYGSMYGNTERMAEALAEGAAEAGMQKIVIHNLSVSETSFVLADVFRYDRLAIGSPTYNGGVFPLVEDFFARLSERIVSNHKLGLFGGYTWSSQAVKKMMAYNEKMKMQLIDKTVEWKQGVSQDSLSRVKELGRLLGE